MDELFAKKYYQTPGQPCEICGEFHYQAMNICDDCRTHRSLWLRILAMEKIVEGASRGSCVCEGGCQE